MSTDVSIQHPSPFSTSPKPPRTPTPPHLHAAQPRPNAKPTQTPPATHTHPTRPHPAEPPRHLHAPHTLVPHTARPRLPARERQPRAQTRPLDGTAQHILVLRIRGASFHQEEIVFDLRLGRRRRRRRARVGLGRCSGCVECIGRQRGRGIGAQGQTVAGAVGGGEGGGACGGGEVGEGSEGVGGGALACGVCAGGRGLVVGGRGVGDGGVAGGGGPGVGVGGVLYGGGVETGFDALGPDTGEILGRHVVRAVHVHGEIFVGEEAVDGVERSVELGIGELLFGVFVGGAGGCCRRRRIILVGSTSGTGGSTVVVGFEGGFTFAFVVIAVVVIVAREAGRFVAFAGTEARVSRLTGIQGAAR